MALSIEHEEADRLAQELAGITGESLADAVVVSLRERLDRERAKAARKVNVFEELEAVRKRLALLPVIDSRSPDEILAYDKNG